MKNKELESHVNRALEDLRTVPPRDPAAAARGRANFLKQAASVRAAVSRKQEARHNGWIQKLIPVFPRKERTPVFNVMMAVLLAAVVFFGGTATTVYAAQDSLPGQSLYPVKTWSEDALLSLTSSSLTRLDHELDFSDRRMAEMAALAAEGAAIPERVMTRLQSELDQALELVAGMEDAQLQQQLEQIRLRAESQLQVVNALMAGAPVSDQPVLLQAQSRIQEQVRLCGLGEMDPDGFRLQVRQRQQDQDSSGNGTPGFGGGAQNPSGTPMPGGNGNGSGGNQPSGTPGHNGPGSQRTPQSGGSGHGP